MDVIWNELALSVPDAAHAVRLVMRAVAAAVLGGVIGYERSRTGKDAGFRTHMLVALGSASFVMAAVDHGATANDVTRVVQGVASGIGFLGAGAILKLSDKREIRGLTTAAGIWMTAATGVCAGLGRYGLATLVAVLSWLILAVVPSPPDEEASRKKAPPAPAA
ncbi:MAG: MgtC/SapB family protein [Vicinamibacterales bacterium]